jgi:hypothetical protein
VRRPVGLRVAALPPQPVHHARMPLLHGPEALGAARLLRPDGPDRRRMPRRVHDRDRPQHADVPARDGLPGALRGRLERGGPAQVERAALERGASSSSTPCPSRARATCS